MDIAGTPVNDSYHFGQTLINDYGRPYWQGVNNVTGFSTSANDGRFAFYVDGEYQYAPTIPAYPLSVRQVIANVDENPLQPPTPISANQFALQDTYAMMKYAGLDWSVGKQSMWWGPGEGGALLMSNNAAPFWMLQINRMEPINIPGLSRFLGPFEFSNFFGALAGHEFPPSPYFFGQKASFKPTENLEFGFTRDDVFGGQGHVPITFGSFWNAFTSINDVSASVKFSRNDPGARHASFDFSYRLPFVRRWLTLYTDSLVHDDVSPVSAPRRSAINPGIYLDALPRHPQARLSRRSGLHRSADRRQHGRTLHLLGSRLPRCLPEWPGHHGQLGRPRRQGLSGVEHLSPQPQEQHSGQREEWQDRRRFHSRRQHAVGLERFRGPVGAQRPRDPTLPAIRNLVGTGAGADAASRLHHLDPVDLVALQTRHPPRIVLRKIKFLKYL